MSLFTRSRVFALSALALAAALFVSCSPANNKEVESLRKELDEVKMVLKHAARLDIDELAPQIREQLAAEEAVHDIPEADKAMVLNDLFPFDDAPSINDTLFDLHEKKPFKVSDYLVIRWGEGHLLASPYFPNTGGMLVDWAAPGSGDVIVNIIRAGKEADGNGREED